MTDKVLPASAEPSPETLLKQAILGARASAEKAACAPSGSGRTGLPVEPRLSVEPRLLGVAAAALGLGALLGAAAMSLGATPGADAAVLAEIQLRLDANRQEAERLSERWTRALAQIQDTAETARSEAKTRHANLAERFGRAEQTITAKLAATGDRLEMAEKEQSARLTALTAQVEKRNAAPIAVAPALAKPSAAEPAETGSLPDKPKAPVTDGWAVRQVYDGVAVLEDRKRRLVEVGPGDTVPGVGRIEAIERRGKIWVVVTKQGTITPQAW